MFYAKGFSNVMWADPEQACFRLRFVRKYAGIHCNIVVTSCMCNCVYTRYFHVSNPVYCSSNCGSRSRWLHCGARLPRADFCSNYTHFHCGAWRLSHLPAHLQPKTCGSVCVCVQITCITCRTRSANRPTAHNSRMFAIYVAPSFSLERSSCRFYYI